MKKYLFKMTNFSFDKFTKTLLLLLSANIMFFMLLFFYVDKTLLAIGVIFLFIFCFFISIFFYEKFRQKETKSLIDIIKTIRENKLDSPFNINLPPNLKELQDEIRLMYYQHQNYIANLKKLERVRTEFLGNVSHELRTPIFAIQGFIETLLNGALEDPKVNKTFLLKAAKHTSHLNNLLNDLIDISMIESGEMRMSFRYFNVYDFLSEIIKLYEEKAEKKGLKLSFYECRKNLQLFGDKNRLKQAVGNLIDNAIKYTELGEVKVYVIEEEKYGIICVEDTGIGIKEEDLPRIFERFYRVDKERSRSQGGTGLGLAIVKHIIEAHGSKVDVKSEFGKGSVFSFALKK